MPSFLEDSLFNVGPIDPNYSDNFIKNLVASNPSTSTTEKKGFWGTIGNIFNNIGGAVGSIFSQKNQTGSLIDLSEIVKLPTVTIDAGPKTSNTMKWLAIGGGIVLLWFFFTGGRRR